MEALSVLLLVFILVSAVAVSLERDLLTAIIIFMVQSTAMAVVWILLRSPDLAITEAAVGSGITTLLMFVTLKKLHAIHATHESAPQAPAGAEAQAPGAQEREEAHDGED